MMNFQHWLYKAEGVLSENKNPRRDAEILLEFITGKTRAFLLAFGETPLSIEEEALLSVLLTRRKAGEPIAYLTEECEFWSLPLYVSKATMIPRPDTECLVEQALLRLSTKPSRVLDLGTGTGAIALSLARERPDCSIIAIDLISDALSIARKNVMRLKMNNVSLFQSNWFDSLSSQKFEMIISNPPYIDAMDTHLLQGDVRFEPLTSLVSPNKGISDLSHIIQSSPNYLTPGGWLIVENGWTQGEIIRAHFAQAGFQCIKTYRDYSNNERLTLGRISK